MSQYYFGQDGEPISSEIKAAFNFSSRDIRWNKSVNSDVYNFVGLVIQNKKQLIVFPKHMFSQKDIEGYYDNPDLGIEQFKLVIEVVRKYLSKPTKSNAEDYAGAHEEIVESNFPFSSFYKIYEYYERYGLFSQKQKQISESGNGKYHWKSIIEKAQPFMVNSGVIFSPLLKEKVSDEHTFITEAMAFVINKTTDIFSFLVDSNYIDTTSYVEETFDDYYFVSSKLSSILTRTFKDIDVELIENLLIFFDSDFKNHSGNDEHIKIRYFNMIWQDMVRCYLNRFFDYADSNSFILSDKAIFKYDFDVKNEKVDNSSNSWEISIDHYHINNKYQYIFDSKYYDNENELNYKQIAYHEFMTKKVRGQKINTISALLLPGEERVSVHYKTSNNLLSYDSTGRLLIEEDEMTIYSVYLSVLKVINSYLQR